MEEVVEESPMLMNKLMTIYLLFAVLMGCKSSQKEKVQTLSDSISYVADTSQSPIKDTELVISNTRDEDVEDVLPDTTINQKLLLENARSLKRFYEKVADVDLFERVRSSPVAIFTNTDNDEYLLAYQYEGNTQRQQANQITGKALPEKLRH